MKKSILILLGLLIASISLWASGNKSTLTVVIKNIDKKEGKMSVSLFNSEGTFLNTGERQIVGVNEVGEMKIEFTNLKPGEYAVSVYHDQNSNGELDTIMFGIPSEPYGFSNDAKGSFGPPSFGDSKFVMTENKTIIINL